MGGSGAAGLGIDFDLVQHAEFIEQRSVDLLHELAVACWCRVEDTYAGLVEDGTMRRTDPNCPKCNGTGFQYRAPKAIRGMVTSMRSQKQLLEGGYVSPGDMLLSPQIMPAGCSPTVTLSAYDKITATWPQNVDEGQVLVRGAAFIGDNAGLAHGMDPNEDRLWFEPAEALWCEDETGRVYQQDADFVLGPGKVIRWVGGQPSVRSRYVIKYRAFMEWIVFAPPQERLDRDGIDLGQLIFLRRRNVAFVNEAPKVTDADRVTLRSRMAC